MPWVVGLRCVIVVFLVILTFNTFLFIPNNKIQTNSLFGYKNGDTFRPSLSESNLFEISLSGQSSYKAMRFSYLSYG